VLRTIPRVLATVGLMAAVATAAGCGDDVDKTQACNDIKQEFQDLSQKSAQQVGDPQALAKTLRESASAIRERGEPVGGEVAQAATDGATALERLAGRALDGSMSQPDFALLIDAGEEIGTACA
jgi:methyl-accepting chemotaxis protein